MAARVFNPETGEWEDPSDTGYVPPGRDPDPYGPPGGGYTVPTGTTFPDPTTPPPDPNPTPTTTTTPPPTTPPPGGGDTPNGGGQLLQGWTQAFAPGDLGKYTLPDVPVFTAPNTPTLTTVPSDFSYKAYTPTTTEDVLADPSYGFRQQAALGAMTNSAAGQGLLRSGGTLYDLGSLASSFASQEFANVDARRMAAQQLGFGEAKSAFDTNTANIQTNNQNLLSLYDRSLAGAEAEFAPKMTEYTTKASAVQRDAELAYARAWDQYLNSEQTFFANQNQQFNFLNAQRYFDLMAAQQANGTGALT